MNGRLRRSYLLIGISTVYVARYKAGRIRQALTARFLSNKAFAAMKRIHACPPVMNQLKDEIEPIEQLRMRKMIDLDENRGVDRIKRL